MFGDHEVDHEAEVADYYCSVEPDVAITMIRNGEEKDHKTRLKEGKNRRKGKTEGKKSE